MQLFEINIYNLLPIIYSVNILLLVINTFVVALLALRERKIKKEENLINQKYMDSISQAQKDAEHLMQTAANKANQLVENVDLLKEQIQNDLENLNHKLLEKHEYSINNSAKRIQVEQEELMDELKNEVFSSIRGQIQNTGENIIQETNSLATDLREKTTQIANTMIEKLNQTSQETESGMKETTNRINLELDAIAGSLIKKSTESNTKISQIVQDALAGALDEINQYKEERKQVVYQNTSKMVLNVTKHILPRTLSDTEHQEIIMKELEKALEEGVFTK